MRPRAPRGERHDCRVWTWVLVAALALLLLPTTLNLLGNPDWRASARIDGEVYRLSGDDVVRQALDPTGAAAVIATLQRWSGREVDEAQVAAELAEGGFGGGLAAFAAEAAARGFEGHWLEVSPADLPRLNVPFVAHLTDSGGRLTLVRRVALGHVYAADPTRGQVLYPIDRFLAAWTGFAFAFPEPPPQPATW